MKKGRCMTCGMTFENRTRAMVDAEFSLHADEKHRIKFRNGSVLRLKYYDEGEEMPKMEVKKGKREGVNLSDERMKQLEATAVWI